MMPWEDSQINLGCGAFCATPWSAVSKRTVTWAELVTLEPVIILNISRRDHRALRLWMQCGRMETAPPIYEVFFAKQQQQQQNTKNQNQKTKPHKSGPGQQINNSLIGKHWGE